MKKTLPLIILIALIAGLLVSWSNTIGYAGREEREYQGYIKKAKELEEKEIYIDAVVQYQKALAMRPKNYDVAMKIVEMYAPDKLDIQNKFIQACKTAIGINPKEPEPYHLLLDLYQEDGWISQEYGLLQEAIDVAGLTEYKNRLLEIKGKVSETRLKYEEVSSFHAFGDTAYAIAKNGGERFLITKESVVFHGEFEEMGLLGGAVIPVKESGEWYYVTKEGYTKRVSDRKAEYLGTFGNGFAPGCIDGVYGYFNTSMKEVHFEFDFAGPFEGGIAAVKKDGKWNMINTSFKTIGKKQFDSILLDEFGYGVTFGVFFAKVDGLYYLYNKEGKCLSEGFEDAKFFASAQPAAVKKDGKWCYIGKNGKLLDSPTYEEAISFCAGFAPVMINGKWGVIDSEYNVIVEPQYDTMTAFGADGSAVVTRDGTPYLIRMTVMNYGG